MLNPDLNLHGAANERLDLAVTRNFAADFRPELFALLRPLHLAHLVEELWAPLCAGGNTLTTVALEERPWPPKGVGARRLRGFCTALVIDKRQAILTPQVLAADQQSNLGLAAALTQLLCAELAEQGIVTAGLWVNRASAVLSPLLRGVGFEAGEMRVVSDGCEFVLYSVATDVLLERLDIAQARLGDLLALKVTPAAIGKLAYYHLGLQAGIAAYWAGQGGLAEIYPGLIDWAALPPASITGTAGPPLPREQDQPIFGS
ncbi:hypothetical protein [Pseudoduganella chitinolytica]|uniref:N-acetyltransferase domain-containing protein n=1 Tax=Pseudoduganella chitinolytica TaxID=34070 RepID=A0ABY8BLS4_9BURK|nr:hypothetical protein [Pseudoduganella chitinolytica]WEF35244.1 hypothetical protein PX653_10950 [Pseudoduganella chitinolytica]